MATFKIDVQDYVIVYSQRDCCQQFRINSKYFAFEFVTYICIKMQIK